MYIYILIIIIILIFLYIINNFLYKKNILEYFNCPSDREGYLCNSENGFGICQPDNSCTPISQLNQNIIGNSNTASYVSSESTISSESTEYTESSESSKITGSSLSQSIPILDTCIDNQDFDKLCKTKFNSKSGVKNIITTGCNNNKSQVECGNNWINGVYYGNDLITTPCLDKVNDFDNWCKYYNMNTIPKGYNVNSIGAKDILVGEYGGCYNDNGTSNNNKARAICDYNHIQTLPKLKPYNKNINYNKFTSCIPIDRQFLFDIECVDILNTPLNNIYVTEKMGYDCNPGYGRAKCINKSDSISPNNIFNNNMFDYNGNINDFYDINVLNDNFPMNTTINSCNQCIS